MTLTRIFENFESGTGPFLTFGGDIDLINEASLSNGIASASGSAHLRIGPSTEGTAFTRFDGYRTGDDAGLATRITIYLDTGMASGEGFEYSVAANGANGLHLRDFVFHVTQDTSSDALLLGVSNNSSAAPRQDLENGAHLEVSSSGWYTFEHVFQESLSGTLEVVMNVYGPGESLLFSETLGAPQDDFAASYGGNRYGWFTLIDVADGIAVDDLSLATVDTAPVQVFAGTTILGAYASIAEAKAAIAASEIAGDTLFIETTGSDDGFFHVVPGMSIQAALDASGDGDTIDIAAGSYAENLVVATAVSLLGAQTSEGEPAVTIGTGAGTALLVTADAASGTLDIANIAADGGAVGVSVATSAQLAGLNLANVHIANMSGSGFNANDTGAVAAIAITGSQFERNALGGSNGTGDIVFFQYTGDITLRDIAITGAAAGTTPRADNAIQIAGFTQASYDVTGPIGHVVLDGVHVTGDYDKPQFMVQGYTDLSGLEITGSSLTGASGWGYLVFIDPISNAETGTVPGTPGRPGAYDGSGVDTSTLDLSGLSVTNTSPSPTEFDVFVRGLAADDVQTGTEANDALGYPSELAEDLGGDDILTGLGGNDLLFGGLGADTLDGGEDTDTAFYRAPASAASLAVTTDAIGFVTAFTGVTTPEDGSDVLSGIEILSFGYGTPTPTVFDLTDPVQLVDGSGALLGTFATIQDAVDAAGNGQEVLVSAGTYREQVLVEGKSLRITGADGATLEAPDHAAIASNGGSFALITAGSGADLVVTGLDIEGRGQGNGFVSGTFAAIAFLDADGAYIDGTISGMRDSVLSGAQHGYGVLARSTAGASHSVAVVDATLLDIQKNAIDARGEGLHLSVTGSQISGAGATDLIAQNGIVLVSDADATLSGNTISGFAYTPGTWSATGILAYDAGVVDITGNTLTAPSTSGSVGIYLYDTEASAITGNSLTGTGWALTQEGAFETAHSEDTGAPNSFAGNVLNLNIASDASSTSYLVNGSPGDDVLAGSDGEDVLSGNGGDDSLVGGNGGDDLSGGAGNDTLEGGGGGDLLDGGDGDDIIQAGGGRDIIRFSAGLDTVNGGAGQDTLLLAGTAADYAILVLGLDHFRITRHADGAVTEATSIETLGFVPAEPLVANDDIFAVTAGDLHVLDVLGNDMGTGMIIGAGLTAGDGTLSVTGAGDALELDLTAAYAYLDAGETSAVNIAYLLSDGASSSDVGFVTVTILGVADPVGPVGDIDGAINAVAEGLAAGAATGITARAIDPDTANWVNYSLLDDADGAFVIDAASGVVTTALTLDREGAGGASRAITVAATSSDGTSSQANFTIAVTDTSDTAISAISDTDTAPDHVLEGAAAGTFVGLTAFASDPDLADTVTYSLDDDAGGAFTIASDSGVLSVADGALIDRESAASLDVTVRATSSDGSHEVRTFTIAIADDDEFDVSAPFDTLGAPGGLVTENAGLGSATGIHVSAQDADATTNGVAYSLLDDDGGRFLVSATTGEVLVAGSVDREDGASRFITVRATSDDGSHADTTFEIQVADVNEFAVTAPVDSDAGENLVGAAPSEGDYTGITVSALDSDATLNAVTYTLLAGGDDFAIDALTGVVTVGAGFDTSGPVTRAITVEALSADGSRAQASFDISVGSAFTIIDGTSGRDNLDGTSGRDVLNGFGDNDKLFGLDGNDVLFGGDGKDRLNGGSGDDEMHGGADNDTYYVDALGDTVIEDASGGTTDTVVSEISITGLFAHVENLELAGTGNLDATGNALDNKITGNGGANVLAGGDGRDKLYGEGGNDTLIGGDEVDILDGGAGDDVLIGNAGRNILTGGAGADMFVLANMPADATTYDKIKDFDALDGDVIALEGTVFTALGLAVEAGEIVMGTEAIEADDFLIFDAGSGKLYYDADGSGAGEAQQIALLDGVTTLSEADILIL
ncbi:beta strand repeat-containing protein [Novosphingobium mangrovi (ex Hu et al. 2023)]|uniref:Cadherin domain-containing protein n=1 Tax=Novosphingobium mangrovi (ex Hu et al. 2023) TaxID=2930094 RepID=A0ABT0AB94_9SPHN|nr:cadherin domain-containing protein [Novosphingobium mangrovi (ex Hu et al. 2023)]MCJ1960467.1 hypothetical protein [Novosphingobium mangrovi (ex Hu et al. 2023)]